MYTYSLNSATELLKNYHKHWNSKLKGRKKYRAEGVHQTISSPCCRSPPKRTAKKQGWYCCPPSFKSCSAISPPLCFASFQLSDNSFAFVLGTPKQNKSYVSLFLENINPLTGQKLFLLHVGQFSVPSLNFQLLYDSLMLLLFVAVLRSQLPWAEYSHQLGSYGEFVAQKVSFSIKKIN